MDKIRDIPEEAYKEELKKILQCIAFYPANGKYVYLLDFGDNYYKFGLTTNIITRIRTHFRHHHFYSVIKIWECGNYIRDVENNIKKYALKHEILKTYRKETEVINTINLNVIINYIDNIVDNLPKNTMLDNEDDEIVYNVLTKWSMNKYAKRKKSRMTNNKSKNTDNNKVCQYCGEQYLEDDIKDHANKCDITNNIELFERHSSLFWRFNRIISEHGDIFNKLMEDTTKIQKRINKLENNNNTANNQYINCHITGNITININH